MTTETAKHVVITQRMRQVKDGREIASMTSDTNSTENYVNFIAGKSPYLVAIDRDEQGRPVAMTMHITIDGVFTDSHWTINR